MSKEWYENIPENGVLCKKSTGAIRLITSVSNNIAYFDGDNKCNGIHVEDLTLLTAAEWWDFALWQGMDSAPLEKEIMVISGTGIFSVVYFMQESQKKYYIKWLPLPTGEL